MKEYRDLLFDADETLFDFQSSERLAFFASAERMGRRLTEAAYRCYKEINGALWQAYELGTIGREEIQSRRFSELLEALGDGASDGAAWNRAYEEELGRTAILFEDSESSVCRLAQHFRLSVITNGLVAVQKSRMARSSIGQYFDRIFISGEIGYAKPDVRFFDAVSAAYPDFDRARAVVIGDSLTGDMEGARRFGVDCIFVDRRSSHPEGCPFALARIADLGSLESLLLG